MNIVGLPWFTYLQGRFILGWDRNNIEGASFGVAHPGDGREGLEVKKR